MVTLLSLDPGTRNFAASVLVGKVVDDLLRVHVVGTTMIDVTMDDMKYAQILASNFSKEMARLEKQYKFSHIVAERYQARGIRGTTVECVNVMLGIMLNQFSHCDISFFTAATWKNRYNRNLDLKDLYVDLKDLESSKKKEFRKTEHELDSCLLGIYHLCNLHNIPHFNNISDYKREKSFLNHFSKCQKL